MLVILLLLSLLLISSSINSFNYILYPKSFNSQNIVLPEYFHNGHPSNNLIKLKLENFGRIIFDMFRLYKSIQILRFNICSKSSKLRSFPRQGHFHPSSFPRKGHFHAKVRSFLWQSHLALTMVRYASRLCKQNVSKMPRPVPCQSQF